MTDLKKWYMSRTVWGAAIAILASLANLLGLDVAPDDEAQLVDAVTALVAAVGGIVAIYGRVSARKRLG